MVHTKHLFVPGRGSYVTSGEHNQFTLNPTLATLYRADVAADAFDVANHTAVVFAGGYHGLAQKWPLEQIKAIVESDQNEASIMADRFSRKMLSEGMAAAALTNLIDTQGESNNSIGDVRLSVARGLLDPNDFQTDEHGIQLVTGLMHGLRFRAILAKALDMDPALISRTPMHDFYGLPQTEFHRADPALAEYAKEAGAIAINALVLRDVRPGNLDDLHDAEERFATFAAKVSH